jgi:hypothetical protein
MACKYLRKTIFAFAIQSPAKWGLHRTFSEKSSEIRRERFGKVCGWRELFGPGRIVYSDCAHNDEPITAECKRRCKQSAHSRDTPTLEIVMTVLSLSYRLNRFAVVFAACQIAAIWDAQSIHCIAEEIAAPSTSQFVEPIPTPSAQQAIVAELPPDCLPAPTTSPLQALNTDIRPRDHKGRLVDADRLPTNCAARIFTERRMVVFGSTCGSYSPCYCDVLGLARFCHQPLYFNDDCLERCGIEHCCCQPAASAGCFYGGALLMPLRVCCQCPCSCVPSGGCCP